MLAPPWSSFLGRHTPRQRVRRLQTLLSRHLSAVAAQKVISMRLRSASNGSAPAAPSTNYVHRLIGGDKGIQFVNKRQMLRPRCTSLLSDIEGRKTIAYASANERMDAQLELVTAASSLVSYSRAVLFDARSVANRQILYQTIIALIGAQSLIFMGG